MAFAPNPPEPQCPRCAKAFRRGTVTFVDGQPIHQRCLAAETAQRFRETQARAAQAQANATTAVRRARRMIDRSRHRTCAVCGWSLQDGRTVLFQGDTLVHAACWRAPTA